MFNIDVSLSGLKSIQNDFRAEKQKIDDYIPFALNYMSNEMLVSLYDHIQSDWYEEYFPNNYDRRTDAGDPDALGGENSTDIQINGKSMVFTYSPKSNQWVPPDTDVSGDHLINIIQTGLGGFWNSKVPKRPFWNNFVREQEQELIEEFITAMQPYTVYKDTNDVFDLSDILLDE
ncbi:MAG: hypothetical protein IKU30_02255 [Clostridia bacterium]|nr:hypothetical protein [Clostridia bacterium]